MPPSENSASVVRRAYDAFARRDLESALAVFAPDAEWIQPDVLPWGGVYRGPDEIARSFGQVGEHVEGGRIEADDVLVSGDHVVVIGRFRGRSRATDQEFAVELCHVWRLVEGRVTWFRNFVDTAALLHVLNC